MKARLDVSLGSADYGPLAPPPGGSVASTVGYYQIGPVTGALGPTGVAATDILTFAGHNLVAGQTVWFISLTGGAGLSINTIYYVINVSGNTFQLSATSGGAAINFTTDITQSVLYGPGTLTTHTIYMGPQRGSEFWSIERVTVANTSTLHVPTAYVYRGVINPSALVDYTPAGTGDVNDLSTPTFLTPGENLVIQFVGSDVPSVGGIIRSTVYLGGVITR